MRRTNLVGRLFPPLLITLVLTLVLASGFTGRTINGFLKDLERGELENAARLLQPRLTPAIAGGDHETVQAICLQTSAETGIRLTVILPDGTVVGDSEESPALMNNHADRPEIARAIAGEVGHSLRFSATLGHQRLYVAVPAGADGPAYVTRCSIPLDALSALLSRIYGEMALIGLVLLALAGLYAYILARRLGGTLGTLREGALAYADGHLGRRLEVDDPVEMADVAHAMNTMAEQLDERMRTTEAQRQELAAVLTSMVEGVIAVDSDETIIRMNTAAANLLGQEIDFALGRSLQEIGRNAGLTNLATDTLRDGTSREQDVSLGDPRGTLLQVQASRLVGLDGHDLGALLVLNDVTRLRRLQNMRKDFVANVSQELKTPITSIKGFVETLIEDPPADETELHRFLGIINRQADRLGHIISDLLSLSRLEQDRGQGEIEFVDLPLHSILDRVKRDVAARQPDEVDRLQVDCPTGMRAPVNAALLEQAVTNLVDNALKYGDPGTPVRVACEDGGDHIAIHVTDRSPGIAPHHLPRLFERFYRVDKARSRRMGGTGLGLAITKHIAQVHGGQATVQSTPGDGSTFTLTLPREVPA